jgi:hypothetical protein
MRLGFFPLSLLLLLPLLLADAAAPPPPTPMSLPFSILFAANSLNAE